MQPIALGDFTIRKFVESTGNVPVPAEIFSGMTPEILQRLRHAMDPRCLAPESDTLYLSMHSFVLKTSNQVILVDTCNGNDKRRTGVMAGMNMLKTDYLANLAALGLAPSDIDIVLCTHLHSDHVGWNTRLENGRWVPTFPNAKYLMSALDVEFYGRLEPEHPQYALTRECYDDSVLPVIDSGQAELVRAGHVVEHEIGDGVWIEGAPGHTPGNLVIHAVDQGRRAIFSGDVYHHPLQIQDPTLHMGVDTDLAAALAFRRHMIERCADTDTILLAAHFPTPTAGRVVRHEGGHRFAFLD